MKEKNKFRFYGTLLYYVAKFLEKTLRVKEIFSEKYNPNEVYIYSLWHNKILIYLFAFKHVKKNVGLASPTKDGELIAVPCEKYGFEMIRGSSDKESVKSLIALLKKVKEGYNVGTPVDGPKGPPHEVKPGMVYLSQKSGKGILPIGVAYDKKWVFRKSWDKFQLPKPFSKAVVITGEPYYVPKDADIDEECKKIKALIDDMERKAQEELDRG